jgi:outer membrane protein OmpA-like peptidoglycan-associated protein
MYSERRAKVTTDLLVKKGIDASRITTTAKGDTEQPFAENDLNRVSICVAE